MGIDISKIEKKKEKLRRPVTPTANILNREIRFSSKIKAKHKEILYKDLATLLNAGVDFNTALTILENQQKNKKLQSLIHQVKDRIVKGSSFHEALQQSGQFSAYEIFSIKIGEETKKLFEVLIELHKYFKRQMRLRKQIVSVITYPAFVVILTIGVLYFMLAYVVPMFKSVFNQFDADLPWLTKNIIVLSEKFPSIILWAALLLLCAFVLAKRYGDSTKFRAFKSKVLLNIPYFGRLMKLIYLARFCQFLDLLLSSRTPLTESLDMVRKTIDFYPIENSIDPIKKDIIKGSPFSKAMKKYRIYDTKMISMVAVAEEINELDTMFSRLAEEYEEEIGHRTKMIGVVLEPVIIVFIGLIVGIIMIAMYAPMFDLSKIISGN